MHKLIYDENFPIDITDSNKITIQIKFHNNKNELYINNKLYNFSNNNDIFHM